MDKHIDCIEKLLQIIMLCCYVYSNMTSMKGSSSGIVDDHTPLWKYVTKVKKLKGEEKIDDKSVVIVLNHSVDHTQELRPILCR